jgi:hypothetical protein
MKAEIDAGKPLVIPPTADPHVVAGVLKLYLRELAEPLMTFALYQSFIELPIDDNFIPCVRHLIEKLPADNRYSKSLSYY